MNPLHKNTFGNSPAAIKLVEIINEKEYIKHGRIGKRLAEFNHFLNEIDNIPDKKIKYSLSNLVFKNFINIVKNYEPPFNTYTHNVLNTNYRKWLNKDDKSLSYKRKQQF